MTTADGTRVVAHDAGEVSSADDLRALALDVRGRLGESAPAVVAVGGVSKDRPLVVVVTNAEARAHGIRAGALAKAASTTLGGGGGGKDDMAQGGGTDVAALPAALAGIAAQVGSAALTWLAPWPAVGPATVTAPARGCRAAPGSASTSAPCGSGSPRATPTACRDPGRDGAPGRRGVGALDEGGPGAAGAARPGSSGAGVPLPTDVARIAAEVADRFAAVVYVGLPRHLSGAGGFGIRGRARLTLRRWRPRSCPSRCISWTSG